MAQQIKALAVNNPDDLSLIPGTHVVDEDEFLQVILSSPHEHHGTHVPTHT